MTNKRLRQISKEVTFPLSKEDKDTINKIIKTLMLLFTSKKSFFINPFIISLL